MLKTKEIGYILLATVVLAICLSLKNSMQEFWKFFFLVMGMFAINIVSKKFAAEYFESEIHIRTWTTSRYGAHPYRKFITPIQIGLLLPFITATITKGIIIWFAPLVFDIKRKIYKVGRRHDKLNSFLETTEKETGKIASFGILMNLIFALIFFLIGFKEFASLNIYFTFFNILPFSDLDGAKIYFSGNKILGILNAWKFLASIIFVATLLSLAFT